MCSLCVSDVRKMAFFTKDFQVRFVKTTRNFICKIFNSILYGVSNRDNTRSEKNLEGQIQ